MGSSSLFVGTERPDAKRDATVTALSPNGTTRWQRHWDRAFAYPRWTEPGVIVVELAGDETGGINTTVALERMTPNKVRWRAPGEFVTVREADNRVVLLIEEELVVRGLHDGEQRQRVNLSDHLDSASGTDERRLQVSAVAGTVYVTSGRTLIAFDPDQGVRWSFEANQPIWVMGVIDETVYVGAPQAVYALEPP
jgi:hypothetical protein